jgi:arginine exporter protein ArgO
MKVWFKLVMQALKVFVLFTGFTILFYYGLMWINEEYQNYHRYDEPQGSALKVSTSQGTKDYHWFDRLLLFYLNGE